MILPAVMEFIFQHPGTMLALAVFAFIAGFVDSVVGGGGLIQLPALLINLPTSPVPTVFGTNKISSICGTGTAAYQYSRRVKFHYGLLAVVCGVSLASSYAGAKIVSYLNVNLLKPLILLVLILIALYTYRKKDLGTYQKKHAELRRQVLFGALIALVVGFYDGFFGPGAGSFLVLGFVMFLGFEFIEASAYAKMVNTMTNIGALMVFIRQGNYILEIALVMAACNMAGSIIGTRVAMKNGNQFVRKLFLVVVCIMIIRYAWDVYTLFR